MTSNKKTSKKSNKKRKHCGNKGKWSPMNVVTMVLAFIVAWPIGLFILFWIWSGRDVGELFTMAKSFWIKNFGSEGDFDHFDKSSSSDNVVFNEYQQAQHDRVSEIKQEIKQRTKHFYAFRSDVKRRADAEEFNSFMSNGPASKAS